MYKVVNANNRLDLHVQLYVCPDRYFVNENLGLLSICAGCEESHGAVDTVPALVQYRPVETLSCP